MRDAARPLLALALVGVLLVAALSTFRGLAQVDPRGRASWTAGAPTFDPVPRDVVLFVPACDVDAVVLHGVTGTATQIHAEFFVAMPDGSARRAGTASASTKGAAPVVLPLGDVDPPWRAPLVVRLRTDTGQAALGPDRPFTLSMRPSRLGTFACVVDAGRPSEAWALIACLLATLVATGTLAAAWLTRAVGLSPATWPARRATLTAALMVGATTLAWSLIVPPFEPPDELAHLQYARFVATTGTLPHAVPPPGDPWRASSYEWVQQPLYYIGAAFVLKATGLDTPAPALIDNPRSRLRPNGTEPTLFHHGSPPVPATGHQALGVLRVLSWLMAVATAWAIARLLQAVTRDGLVITTVAGGLALVPQWDAVMGAVSTDPPATLLAALATLAMVRVVHGRTTTAWLLSTGLLIGAAYAVKATAVFLAPMAVLACVLDAANRERIGAPVPSPDAMARILRRALGPVLLVGLGIALAAAWVHVRAWLVFGDPQAFGFKKAILEAGGFVPVAGPMPWTAEFWTQMRVMVFEPFWARFGSLGAGPFPGSRVWLAYGMASVVIASAAAGGLPAWLRAGWREVKADGGGRAACTAMAALVCLIGVALGLAAWLAVNLVPRADMVVHWTPRHVLPLTAPAALLVGASLECVRDAPPLVSRALAALVGTTLLALGLASLSVLKATVLMFHFGY